VDGVEFRLVTNISSLFPESLFLTLKASGSMILNLFDQMIKSGISVDDINDRTIPKNYQDTADRINQANITSLYGTPYQLDQNADLIMDTGIFIYRFDSSISGDRKIDRVCITRNFLEQY
jgi:hypothetical protein